MRYRYERWCVTEEGTIREGAHKVEGPYHYIPVEEWFGGTFLRGVPAYHPTEHQPARCGGTEA